MTHVPQPLQVKHFLIPKSSIPKLLNFIEFPLDHLYW
jgi:hypothetical protein